MRMSLNSLSCTFMHVRRRPGRKALGILAAHMAPAGTLVTWHNTWTPAPSCTRDTLMTRLEAPSMSQLPIKASDRPQSGPIDLPSMTHSCGRWNVGFTSLHFRSGSARPAVEPFDWDLLPEMIQFSVYHFTPNNMIRVRPLICI